VEARNSCARILIFGSFLLLSFVKFFFPALFRFFDLAFYCLFSCLIWFFYRLLFSSSFLLFFVPFFGSCGFISCIPQLAWEEKAWMLLDVVDAATLINGERHAFY
jgi:hypothetical protein